MLKIKWSRVLEYNNLDQKPLVRWIDLANGTMFRLTAFFVHGGYQYPRPGLLIALERVGCFFFGLPEKPLAPDYVAEKLFLPPSDAAAMTDWINAQCGFTEAKQFGEYTENYIYEADKPHGLGGEKKIMPLIPQIIREEEIDESKTRTP